MIWMQNIKTKEKSKRKKIENYFLSPEDIVTFIIRHQSKPHPSILLYLFILNFSLSFHATSCSLHIISVGWIFSSVYLYGRLNQVSVNEKSSYVSSKFNYTKG